MRFEVTAPLRVRFKITSALIINLFSQSVELIFFLDYLLFFHSHEKQIIIKFITITANLFRLDSFELKKIIVSRFQLSQENISISLVYLF